MHRFRWCRTVASTPLCVGDLLGEDSAPGAGETFAASASVTVALPAGGLHGFSSPGHRGQFF